ncbi:MAG: hypothetical protein CVV27_09840, partial [Candidatus Melainabacteria bacterium HGW-Melainabacteria-1]
LLREGLFRLPTEAEWEFACRGDQGGGHFFGSDASQLGDYAWYLANADGRTHPVGTRQPNPYGLYDLYGNVWEWCRDYFAAYPGGHALEPTGPESGKTRALRGGGWNTEADRCQTFVRWHQPPETRSNQVGFRLLLETGQKD